MALPRRISFGAKCCWNSPQAGFRVIAPDLLGYGYSGKPRNLDYTIARQAEMVVSFMQRLGIDRAVLVGSSYGGAIAATIALDHPDLVEKLVLVGAVNEQQADAISVDASVWLANYWRHSFAAGGRLAPAVADYG